VTIRLASYWDALRSSFWFLPLVMAVGAVALAFGSVALDAALPDGDWRTNGWIYSGGADGASAVLGAIAGSMVTLAGLVFSLTLVVLSLASQQFGPRLLRNFMRDTTNQVVLGTFVATFLYCLLVLRTVRRVDESPFVPHVSVTLGVLLAVASLIVLIVFIHHVAVSIQADEIVARVGAELTEGIDHLFPEEIGEGPSKQAGVALPEHFDRDAAPVPSAADGYIQFVDGDALLALAAREGMIFRVERRPGDYVIADAPLVVGWPAAKVDEGATSRVNAAFVFGNQRTPAQDLEYPIRQLVEIAVRALSPGINDPFTATACIDRLASGLSRLARRETPSAYRFDDAGMLRVVAAPTTFPAALDAAFDQIRHYGRNSPVVLVRLLEALAAIGEFVRRPEDAAAARRQIESVAACVDPATQEADRARIEAGARAALQRLALS
jgi:uncharacterized membrane protein